MSFSSAAIESADLHVQAAYITGRYIGRTCFEAANAVIAKDTGDAAVRPWRG